MFADGISQVIAYGMVLAALSDVDPDVDHDGHITVAEARTAIRILSPVMAAAFAPLIDKPVLSDAVRVELGALETLISAIDAERVNRSADSRGEPWLYFYEDFLAVYDLEERRQAGVYYTPLDVVQAMVKITDHILVEKFGKRLGFADPGVVTLDPATGTGTFPLAVIDQAVSRAETLRGKAGKAQAAQSLSNSLMAFEMLPGPYSVAHLRLTQRLRDLSPNLEGDARVILTDTLESPLNPKEQLSLFGDAQVLAAEQNRAKRAKLDKRVTVVIGNPPYRRVERETEGRGSGGWVVDGQVPNRKSSKSLFDDILDIAKTNTVFSHHASLYNLYVYFWRWALWKAFEAHGNGPGVVAFITANSWLSGPGFMGLRQLVRESCDEVWVLDLGGDNKGANPDENIFAIETPVAIAILVRKDAKNRKEPAAINYRRISGTAQAKLEALAAIVKSDDPLAGEWIEAPSGWLEPIVPPTGNASWQTLPLLKDIFPWQQPGCKFGRTWPIAPSAEILQERWQKFAAAGSEEKPDLFKTAKTGRNTGTKVGAMKKLIDLQVLDASEKIVRYAYRSFDRQWTFADPRLAKTESPSLWNTISEKQIFFSTLMTGAIGEGPCLTVTSNVPDLHYFCGRGGKDILPLYRDQAGNEPNLTRGFAKALADHLSIAPPSVEDVAAYVYALLSSPAFHARFSDELRTPGLRLPVTASKDLWAKAVSEGHYLIWLHTYAQRFRDQAQKRGPFVPILENIGWEYPVTSMPVEPSSIAYDPQQKTLTVGDGKITGVRNSVWAYSVSGMPVLRKWLGYRTVKGSGKAASSKNALDKIRPQKWPDEWNDELLDLIRILTITIDKQPAIYRLVNDICEGKLLTMENFPQPKQSEREVPEETDAPLLKPKG